MEVKLDQRVKEETITKVEFLLSQDKKEETIDDKLFKYEMEIIFKNGDNCNVIVFPNIIDDYAKLIVKIVDLLFLLFNKGKGERKNLYDSNIYEVKNDNIMKIVKQLQVLQTFDIEVSNTKISELFNIISITLESKEKYSLADYIDSALVNLAFVPTFELLLKYKIFSMIIRYYLNMYGVVLNFHENDINITDNCSLELIIDLFKKNHDNANIESFVQGIVVLHYESLSDIFQKSKLEQIIAGIKSISSKVKNFNKNVLCVEKIIVMFREEMEKPEETKKKKRRKKKKKKNNEDKQMENEKNKLDEGDIIIDKKDEESLDVQNIQKDIEKDINKEESSNSISGLERFKAEDKNYKIQSGDNFSLENKINNCFDKIKNIGNENIEKELDLIKQIMLNVVDDNNKMKKDFIKLNQDIDKLTLENKKLNQEITKITEEKAKIFNDLSSINKKMKKIKDDYDEMKDVLSEIQCKDFAKNFLECFYPYLSEQDFKCIRADNYTKGEVISNQIINLFSKANQKKLNVLQSLIKSSSNLIGKDNNSAHSLTIEKYQNEMIKYKEKNNLDNIDSPTLFCFLVSLNISQDLFEDSFTFLKKYFNDYLKTKNSIGILESYLN